MSSNFSMLDAFVSLNDVDDDAVKGMIKSRSLTEGKSFDINSTADELDEAKKMLEASDDSIEVIDVNADTLEHIKAKADYVGQFILTCRRCRTNRFIEADVLEPDTDDPDLYNVADECPNCHSEGSGFELMGQVGKVQKEEPEAETAEASASSAEDETELEDEATLDNDMIKDDATFDNDFEPTDDDVPAETPEVPTDVPEVPSDEEDLGSFEDDEVDGMETTSSEDDDLIDTAELGDQIEAAKPKKEDNEDVAEAFKPNDDILEMNKYAKEAWLMNRVISSMNNEEAYYGSWLYYWPDGCDEEECAVTFNDKETFEELKDIFEKVYVEYHEDELFDADSETFEYARKQDKRLGLRPIENLKPKFKESLTEDFDSDSLKDLFKLIVDVDDIEKVEVYDSESGKKVFQGPCSDLTPDLKGSKLSKFTVGINSTLTLIVSSDVSDEKAPRVKDVLKVFSTAKNDVALFELLDDGDEKEIIVKDVDEAIDKYGDLEVISIEQPSILKLFLACPQMVALEDVEKDPTDKLVEDILNANNLSVEKIDKPFASEYWIAESIYSGEDLSIIFEQYVRDHQELVYEFKKVTGFRTKLEEQFMEEHDVGSLDDLYEQLYHIKKEEAQPVQEVFLDVANSIVADDDTLVESSEDPYDRIYNDIVKLLADKGYDVNDTYVKDYIEASVEEVYDIYLSVEEWFEDIQNKYPEELQRLKKVNECKKEPTIKSFKDRKELAEAIQECKNNTRPYTVRRSTVEGYRYDLIEDFEDGTGLVPSDQTGSELVSDEGALLLPAESKAALDKIRSVSIDIAEAIKKYYDIDADPKLIVADIVQDLSLISGHVRPEDLEDTALNRLTIQMYHDYNQFYNFMDQLFSLVSGESIVSTPESKFRDAIKILNGPAFSKETIDKTIASQRFLLAARAGAVPYIPSNITPRLTEDFSDSRYEAAKDELLNTLAEYNYDISDKDVKLFAGNQVHDFITKFDLDTNAWFEYVSVHYKSALDRLQKLDYIKEDLGNMYDVYRLGSTLELVRIIKADSLEDAKEKAVELGYDLEYYRVEESDDLNEDIQEDVNDFNPDDPASDQIDAESDNAISDEEIAKVNAEISELDNPVKYMIKTSTLVPDAKGDQVDQVENFVALSKEEADAKYEELIASGLYDEVELPIPMNEDLMTESVHKIYVNGELKDEINSANPIHDVDKKAYEYKNMNGVEEVRIVYADGSTNNMKVESK